MNVQRTTRPFLRARTVLAAACMLAASVASAGAEMLQAGAVMPSFALANDDAVTVDSASLSGKTYLVWFYPKARTPGCTVEARGLRDQYTALQAAGVTVLGVSFDSPEDNKAFVQAEQLPFHLLSDSARKLAMATGAADSPTASFARRISYLVGPDGKVRKAWPDVDPSTHASEVLAEVSGKPVAH